jgi:hypothetical protein
LWRPGIFLRPPATGPLSWACTLHVTTDFTSSGWPWFLSIWSSPPQHWKNQVEGKGADKQKVKHGNSERLRPEEKDRRTFPFLKLWDHWGCGCYHLQCLLDTVTRKTFC